MSEYKVKFYKNSDSGKEPDYKDVINDQKTYE